MLLLHRNMANKIQSKDDKEKVQDDSSPVQTHVQASSKVSAVINPIVAKQPKITPQPPAIRPQNNNVSRIRIPQRSSRGR